MSAANFLMPMRELTTGKGISYLQLVDQLPLLQVFRTLFGANFGDVDVEVTDRVVLERFFTPCIAFNLRQPADVVALEQAMQG